MAFYNGLAVGIKCFFRKDFITDCLYINRLYVFSVRTAALEYTVLTYSYPLRTIKSMGVITIPKVLRDKFGGVDDRSTHAYDPK